MEVTIVKQANDNPNKSFRLRNTAEIVQFLAPLLAVGLFSPSSLIFRRIQGPVHVPKAGSVTLLRDERPETKTT